MITTITHELDELRQKFALTRNFDDGRAARCCMARTIFGTSIASAAMLTVTLR
jgi:hypothetical protein